MPPSSPSHVFLYEQALCTVAEGQTLDQWRRGDEANRPAPARRGRLRVRLGTRRTAAKRS